MIYGERELAQRRDMICGAPLNLYGGAFPQNVKKKFSSPTWKIPLQLTFAVKPRGKRGHALPLEYPKL
jgi:hypothetical protein